MIIPNLDDIAQKIANMPYGLVVIDGPKGSGKSSLLNRVESILGEGQLCDNFKLARAKDCSANGKFQLIDVGDADADVTGLQQTFRFLMRWYGYRTLAIEDIETMGSNTKYLINNAIDLALTGTLVIITMDALALPDGRNIVETIDSQGYLGLEPLWISLPLA